MKLKLLWRPYPGLSDIQTERHVRQRRGNSHENNYTAIQFPLLFQREQLSVGLNIFIRINGLKHGIV